MERDCSENSDLVVRGVEGLEISYGNTYKLQNYFEEIYYAKQSLSATSSKRVVIWGFHLQTRIPYKLGFNENDYTSTLILPRKIALCSKFP